MTPRDPKRCHYRKFPTQYTIYLPLGIRLYWPHGVPCLFSPVSLFFFISQRIVTLQDVIITDNSPLIYPWEPVVTDRKGSPGYYPSHFLPFFFISKLFFRGPVVVTLQDVISTIHPLITIVNLSLVTPRVSCLLPPHSLFFRGHLATPRNVSS